MRNHTDSLLDFKCRVRYTVYKAVPRYGATAHTTHDVAGSRHTTHEF